MVGELKGHFRELNTWGQAMRYLETASGSQPPNVRQNIKMMYEKFGENDFAIGVMTVRCLCGNMGDDGMLECIKKDSDRYTEAINPDRDPDLILCQRCQKLAMCLIQNFEMTAPQAQAVSGLVWHLKTGNTKFGQIEVP